MKKWISLAVLLMLLFNWIGNQLYTTITEQVSHLPSGTTIDQKAAPDKIAGFHLPAYVKEIDADDLLEFTTGHDNTETEMVMNVLNGLFPDRTSTENRHVSYKFFNGEYYCKPDNRLSKPAGDNGSLKLADRYILKIPTVFLSPNARPPQQLG